MNKRMMIRTGRVALGLILVLLLSPLRAADDKGGPLDRLDPKLIPALERFDWQPKELVAVLGEHRGRQGWPVSCVAASPNGKLVASAGSGAAVRVWDPASLRLHAFLGTSSSMTAIAFSADSKLLASSAADGTVHVWTIEDRSVKPLVVLRGPTTATYALAIAPDGKSVIAGGYDMFLRLWDLTAKESKEKEKVAITAHAQPITSLAYSPDGRTVASGGQDGVLKLWDMKDNSPRERFGVKEHTAAVSALAFSPDGKSLASGGNDATIRIWNVGQTKPAPKTMVKAHGSYVYALVYSASGKSLASCGNDATARLWDAGSALRERAVFEGHAGPVTGVALSPDGRTLYTGSSDWTVRAWDIAPKPAQRHVKGHVSAMYTAAFAPTGVPAAPTLATGSEDRTIRLWDLTGAEPKVRTMLKGDSIPIYALAYAPDGKSVAAAGAGITPRFWDTLTSKPLRRFEGHTAAIGSLATSSDGRYLITASSDKTVRVWNTKSGNEVHRFGPFDTASSSVALSPDGRYALAGNGGYLYDEKGRLVVKDGALVFTDCVMHCWDTNTGKELHRIPHTKIVNAVAFTPDGKQAISGSWDTAIRFWNLAGDKPEEVRTFTGKSGYVQGLDCSPDGKMIASLGPDFSVVLWDVASGKRLKEWNVQERVTRVEFSPDSRYLVMALSTGVGYVLRLD